MSYTRIRQSASLGRGRGGGEGQGGDRKETVREGQLGESEGVDREEMGIGWIFIHVCVCAQREEEREERRETERTCVHVNDCTSACVCMFVHAYLRGDLEQNTSSCTLQLMRKIVINQ
jgi:hypothetical protein